MSNEPGGEPLTDPNVTLDEPDAFDPVEERWELLEDFVANPDNENTWTRAYEEAVKEEDEGDNEFSDYDDIPADDLLHLARRVRALETPEERYRLMTERAPNGERWIDALTGFSSTEVENGLDQHLASQLREQDKVKFEVGIDLGCGTGRTSRILAEHCISTTAIDTSAEMLSLAEERSDDNIDYKQGDATQLPFEDGSVDVITSIGLMGALDGQQKAALLTEVARVLKDGGALVVGYNNRFNKQIKRIGQSWKNVLADMITDVVSGRVYIDSHLHPNVESELRVGLGLATGKYSYSWAQGAEMLEYAKDSGKLALQRRGYRDTAF